MTTEEVSGRIFLFPRFRISGFQNAAGPFPIDY